MQKCTHNHGFIVTSSEFCQNPKLLLLLQTDEFRWHTIDYLKYWICIFFTIIKKTATSKVDPQWWNKFVELCQKPKLLLRLQTEGLGLAETESVRMVACPACIHHSDHQMLPVCFRKHTSLDAAEFGPNEYMYVLVMLASWFVTDAKWMVEKKTADVGKILNK